MLPFSRAMADFFKNPFVICFVHADLTKAGRKAGAFCVVKFDFDEKQTLSIVKGIVT